MKKIIYLTIILSLTITSMNSIASDKKVGLGAMIGSYTALSGEYIVDNNSAFDSSLAFDAVDPEKFYFHVAKLFHRPNSLKFDGQVFGWYHGLGVRYRKFSAKKNDDDDYKIGGRASAGLLYSFDSTSLKVFSEGSFVLNVIPETSSDLDINIGLRYYF